MSWNMWHLADYYQQTLDSNWSYRTKNEGLLKVTGSQVRIDMLISRYWDKDWISYNWQKRNHMYQSTTDDYQWPWLHQWTHDSFATARLLAVKSYLLSCSPTSPTAHGPVQRNPSAIKEMLLEWCKVQCAGYEVNLSFQQFDYNASGNLRRLLA